MDERDKSTERRRRAEDEVHRMRMRSEVGKSNGRCKEEMRCGKK